MTQKKFKSDVSELLSLIIHSLYSNQEIFIREIISNASDAIDKLKFLSLTELKGIALPPEHRIDIKFDEKDHTWISIADTGIGMNKEELEAFLGTIANSGTRTFLKNIDKEGAPSDLIGQFGVGFYSAFMVAESVTVTTLRADEKEAWKWYSKGLGAYQISEVKKEHTGTEIMIILNEKGKKFADDFQLKEVVKRYSDHISHPIYLTCARKEYDDKGAEKPSKIVTEKINDSSAIWKRAKNDITEKEYEAFYQSLGHDQNPPLLYIHLQAEGIMEYAALCYVPKEAPVDMYYSDFRTNIRLYIQRVFITDDHTLLIPTYLRFVRGIIDSEDLPLNVSRETLQENTLLTKIRNSVTKKILNKFSEAARAQPQLYTTFITQYNRPLKEGLYQDFANKKQLLELVRFYSTHSDQLTSLSEYKGRAKESQKYIYYLSGTELGRLRNSPLLEHYTQQNVEVLLLADEIDEMVVSAIGPYQEMTLKPINKKSSDTDDIMIEKRDKKLEQQFAPLKEKIAQALKGKVEKVEFSARLSSSPACIIFSEHALSERMKDMLRNMGGSAPPEEKPILEINPAHSIIQSLHSIKEPELFNDLCMVLLEQSLLIENIPFPNSHDFVARVNRLIERAVRGGVPDPNSSHANASDATTTRKSDTHSTDKTSMKKPTTKEASTEKAAAKEESTGKSSPHK